MRPASDSRCGHVGARIERDETGIRRVWPGRCSRMSKTPCPAGSTPVRNDGQAAHECDGMHRSGHAAGAALGQRRQVGQIAGGQQGSRISQSAPSQPTTSTRFAMGGQDTGAAAPGRILRRDERLRPARFRGRRGGRLAVGGVPLGDLAARHGTPLLVYDEATLRGRARAYREGLSAYPGPARIAFACKAQTTVAVLQVLLEEGLGMDVASEGELAFAVAAGTPGERLIVHGNNKSDADLSAALAAGAGLVVADHDGELDQIERLAAAPGRVQPLLVRVNPAIEADTHRKIATGHAARSSGSRRRGRRRARIAPPPSNTSARPACTSTSAPRSGPVDTYVEAAAWLAAYRPRGPGRAAARSTSAAGSPSPTPTATGCRTCAPRSRPTATVVAERARAAACRCRS